VSLPFLNPLVIQDSRVTERRTARARADWGPPSTEQALGALPVAAGFCRRLDLAGIIDRAAPVRDVALSTHGQVIEALIANRLTSPRPLVHIGEWAREFAAGPVLGLGADVLNDDRIGRALDALAEVAEEVTGSAGAAAITEFGVDVAQVHWDMTSVSLHGGYRHCDEDYPQPKYGHPKDRRTDLKQVQAGVAASADGAVPLFFRPYDGGAGEVSQVTGAMEALRRLAGPRRFLMVGDSKLLSYPNIAALTEAEVDFLGPASKSLVPASVLAGCDYDAASPAGFTAARDAARRAGQRGTFRVTEDTMTVAGPRKRDPSYTVRRIFVHSSASAQGAAASRDRKLARAAADLGKLQRAAGSRCYKTPEQVTAKITAIARGRHVGDYLRTEVTRTPSGKPVLEWHFDQDAIGAEAATDGWYALLTSLPPDVTAARVLARYKNQPAISERRYHDLKGPLALAPMFLHGNKRITAIIAVICLALLVYCLAEREARRNLAPATTIDGLYAGRPARPTASLIFSALATLRLRARPDGTLEIPQPDPLQLRLLDLLKIDPRTMVDQSLPHVRITGLADGDDELRRGDAGSELPQRVGDAREPVADNGRVGCGPEGAGGQRGGQEARVDRRSDPGGAEQAGLHRGRRRRRGGYRELGFGLDTIAVIVDDPGSTGGDHLRRQRQPPAARIARCQAMVAVIDKELSVRKLGISLTPQERLENS